MQYLCSQCILDDCSETLFQRISIHESDSQEGLLGTLKAEIMRLSQRYDVYQMHIACQLLSDGNMYVFGEESSPPSFREEWISREGN